MTPTKSAVIMAGGTGGHIFPGLALAQALQQQGWKVSWIGTKDKMEADIVPKYDIPIDFINVKGVRGNGLKRLITLPFMLIRAFWQARQVLKRIKPNIVVGFGGYASGPGGLAAKSLGIPLMIHEQNAVLGLTNKWLAKLATKTLLAFPNALTQLNGTNVEVIGNPVRESIADLNGKTKRSLSGDDEIRVLVVGGSLGARVLNQTLPKIFSQLIKTRGLEIYHQVGKGNGDNVTELYKQHYSADNLAKVTIKEFIDDMPAVLDWADLVICRAGALTVSELAASGNLGIFVPLPHAVDDHQTANANWLVAQDAGKLVPQQNLLQVLPALLEDLLSKPEQINRMQKNAAQQANIKTTQRMLELCNELERIN